MAGGLREALRQISDWNRENRASRIVLLTDGEATDRLDDSRALADEAGNLGVPIIALGFGHDWNEDFLFDLADRSVLADPGTRHGSAEFIPTPQDIGRVFEQVYNSMQVVARDVTLTVRMVQGLEARRVWQVSPAITDLGRGVIQGRAVVIPVGQLEKGGTAFLVELMLPPRPAGPVRIAQSEGIFTVPDSEPQRQSADLILEYTEDPAVYGPFDGHVMNVIEKVQAFKLQSQALEEARDGNIGSATRKLRQAVTILLSQGEDDLAGRMEAEANNLEQSGAISSEGKKTIMLTSRKTVRLSD
jgi:Ca-activated chloride channel homolog